MARSTRCRVLKVAPQHTVHIIETPRTTNARQVRISKSRKGVCADIPHLRVVPVSRGRVWGNVRPARHQESAGVLEQGARGGLLR
jgi:hypothetical protein